MYIFSVHSNYARLWISGWLWMEELNSNAWLTQNQETLRSDRAPLQEFNQENRSGTTKVSYNLDSHWILLRGWKVDITPHKSPLLHVFYYYEIPVLCVSVQFSSVTQSCLTLCNPMDCSTPGFPVHSQVPCSNWCPSSWWCHPTMSSSVIPFSSCLQSFPASGSFPMNQFFASGGQSIGVSASVSVLPMNIQDWFPLGWTGWISLHFKGLSKVLSNTTESNSHIHTWLLEKP